MAKIKPQGATTRRKHTNSKLGCLNCKRKKIRCNENLPECGNCAKGKKERCSYLSLSQAEIDRIRLTHSLRNSQNKLLNQDYRLPTSATKDVVKSKPATSGLETALEFKFELSKLPLKIPSFPYPPIQFNNLSVNDFSSEFRVINEYDVSDDNSSVSIPIEDKKLPGGFTRPISFKRLDYNYFRKNGRSDSGDVKLPHQLSYHITLGKVSILDHFQEFLLSKASLRQETEIVYDTFICLGQTIVLNQLNNMIQYNSAFAKKHSRAFVDQFEKKCFEAHGKGLGKLRVGISHFHSIENTRDRDEMDYYSAVLGYGTCFLTFSILMLNFSAESYFNSSKGVFAVFEVYARCVKERNMPLSPLYEFLVNNIQINITSINIPSYNPEFLLEILSNINSLEPIYVNQTLKFKDDELNHQYSEISYHYTKLVKFFNELLLPNIIQARNEEFVSTYSPTIIFEIMKKWICIFPSQAMTYNPTVNVNSPDESIFLNDLTTTLYMYYYSVSAVLDAVFPACKYLFGISYMSPTSKFFMNRDIMTTNNKNPYHQGLFKYRVDNLLQRHNYYSMRLFSFFRRRLTFYQDHLMWSNPYSETLRQNRFRSRSIKDSLEISIKSFNTTLIRPEHYPTKDSRSSNSIFTRTDATMQQKLYTRNIETLDFFNESSILHFDYETMLLLQDYRPVEDNASSYCGEIDMNAIREYFEDKTIILNSLR
ncbi:uncharacterized protein RJT20DRAFT_24742 [Scheffersomyces xylosifermentans]|uniref:uncharacterized protein n=1 Tax=Scheffersomyces xylosifermentans TaxID=1304137 RepID=UPI00315D2056